MKVSVNDIQTLGVSAVASFGVVIAVGAHETEFPAVLIATVLEFVTGGSTVNTVPKFFRIGAKFHVHPAIENVERPFP